MIGATAALPRASRIGLGRSFVHPLFDLFVIGGLLTVPVALYATRFAGSAAAVLDLSLPVIMLLCNNAHFAASTVRLYTKPGSFDELPFLTSVFPLVTLIAASVCVVYADQVGGDVRALYLTWSPYHYAAQTFGLAAMYCYRSGCALDRAEWWALRLVCLLPFLVSLISGAPLGTGIGWPIPYRVIANDPVALATLRTALTALRWASMTSPIVWLLWVAWRGRRMEREQMRSAPPLISLCLLLSNASWWSLFAYWDAQVWATVLHGLQYLGVVTVFHVEDRVAQSDNRHGRAFHAATVLVACVALGYLLFQCWPRAYIWAGYGKVESLFMVMAAINIHHFIVDRYIWRIRKDRNYRTVVG